MAPLTKRILIKRVGLVAVLGLTIAVSLFFSGNNKSPVDILDTTPRLAKQVKIVAFGDSLTAGYGLAAADAVPVYLEEALRNKGYDTIVYNAGVSGDTSSGGLTRLPSVLATKPDIVIVQFGANDVLKGRSIEQARQNITQIIKTLQGQGITVLLAGLQPPIYSPIRLSFDALDFYKQIAADTDVLLYPNFMQDIFDKPHNPALTLPDMVHPSAQGAKLMSENIEPYISRLLQNFMVK